MPVTFFAFADHTRITLCDIVTNAAVTDLFLYIKHCIGQGFHFITGTFQKVKNKRDIFDTLLKELNLQPSAVGYMGDDWLDLPVMIRVGFAATVADAVPEVLQVAHYVAKRKGGRGAVREVCDLILEARGAGKVLLEKYMQV